MSVLLPSSTEPAREVNRSRPITVRATCASPTRSSPSRLRSSMDASDVWSSMRVAPRSVTVVVAVSAMISSTVAASDATGHVQVMSPTVRKRTRRVTTSSPARGGVSSVTGTSSALAQDHFAVVRVVDVRDGEALARDVLPDVELGPVGNREDAQVLAGRQARVVEAPELRALVARVPLAELVAVREDALLGAGLFLVAARAAEERVELEFLDRVEQRHRLVHVAALVGAAQLHAPGADRIAHASHDEALAELGRPRVAKRDHLGEIVLGVDVQQRERKAIGPERLLGDAQHHDGILAAREEQRRIRGLAHHLAHDVDRFALEPVEVRQQNRGQSPFRARQGL